MNSMQVDPNAVIESLATQIAQLNIQNATLQSGFNSAMAELTEYKNQFGELKQETEEAANED